MSAAMPNLKTRESFSPGPSRVKWNDKWFDFLFRLTRASGGHREFKSAKKSDCVLALLNTDLSALASPSRLYPGID